MAEYIDIDYPLLFKDIRNREIRVTVRDLLKANHAECVLADVAPVRHGWWIKCTSTYCMCSECKRYWIPIDDQYDYHYCPNCGAKMDKEKE